MWGEKFSEIDELKGEKQKIQFWHDFWNPTHPESEKPSRETFEEFMDRMFVVNEKYPASQISSLSDRGIVYMRFGPPDEIERHPFDREFKSFENWYYYSQAMYLKFVDEKGIGDYRIADKRMRRLLLSR
jgi:GWxTD domain-containing protein